MRLTGPPSTMDPERIARQVRLRYVTDCDPGISRRRRGSGFIYLHPSGRVVRDAFTLGRICGLAIPPAWTGVWICPDPNGHLQATGRDAVGRKQYRYHDRWNQISSLTKYDHLLTLADVLPALRRSVDRDMQRAALDRRRVVAGMVRLMDLTLIRIGNDCYARQNGSFGLTTLRDKHVHFGRGRAVLSFTGKSGQHQEREVHDPRLVSLIRRCHDLPGYRLFQYLDADGVQRRVDSGDINDYIRTATGRDDLSAKDFRTWGGTVWGAVILGRMGPPRSKTECKKNVCAAIKQVAAHLGNRPATCRKYYIHPAITRSYETGRLTQAMKNPRPRDEVPRHSLSAEEAAVRKLLAQSIAAPGVQRAA